MKTTTIKTNDSFDNLIDAIEFVNGNYSSNTKEVKVVYNPQAKKFVAQLVDVTE